MSTVYRDTLKATRMNAVVTDIGSAGKLVIGTSALAGATGVLVTITLNTVAGTVSGTGILTLGQSPALLAAISVAGTAAKAELRTSADVTVVSGLTVGTSGTDIIVGNTNFQTGNNCAASGSIVHG